MTSPTRRSFLETTAAAALSAPAVNAGFAVPSQIKAFCVDYNWLTRDGVTKFAPPGHWATTAPDAFVRWHEEIGVNTIQTFVVSCNGYAWYKNGIVPPQPGLQYDFLTDVVKLGHKKNMLVMGYFCIASNSRWGAANPALSYGAPSTQHIPFTDEYLDFLSGSMQDAIRKTGLDGYMIDWVWNPAEGARKDGWIDCEKKLFEKYTGTKFPAGGKPAPAAKLAYERKAIDHCWERIRDARDSANRDCILWLSVSDMKNPTIENSKLLKECDWVMNEAPDRERLELGKKMVGPKTRMIQNVVGWPKHDARAFLLDPANRNLDYYGFAEARDSGLPLPSKDYLRKPLDAFSGTERNVTNDRNIAALARFYKGIPL